MWSLPVGWDDLRAPLTVAEATALARQAEAELLPAPRVVVAGTVKSVSMLSLRGKRGVRVVLADGGGGAEALDAWWFYVAHGVLAVAKKGAACLLVGRVRARAGKRPSTAHPDLVPDEPGRRGVRARYPGMGVAPGTLRRAVTDTLARVGALPDPVPEVVVRREWLTVVTAPLRSVHGAHESPPHEARVVLAERLAWVEGFTRVWQRRLAEASWGGARAPVLPQDPAALERFTAAPRVRADGRAAPGGGGRGERSGVALADAPAPAGRRGHGEDRRGARRGGPVRRRGRAVRDARAHRGARRPVPRRRPARGGGGRGARRAHRGRDAGGRAARGARGRRKSGAAGLAIGTHALLEQDVDFARLGLVIVDEQQRLGVAQRLRLVQKGTSSRPHLLSLSATPIPRTLALALRGELATSVLDERPRGRPPVDDRARRPGQRAEASVLEAMRAACVRGERVFFVSPRIDDDEEDEEPGVVSHAARLARDLAPARVLAVHGAMAPAERLRAMRAFRAGEAQVLVGTTVVEVGVDVPEATLMVVDGAERFGLAQLHQLRGRVGRGDRPGACLLVHDEPLEDLARRRLETLARTSDGTEVATADLALRGAGDLGGTRQSGAELDFVWLDPASPPAWMERLEGDAREPCSVGTRASRPPSTLRSPRPCAGSRCRSRCGKRPGRWRFSDASGRSSPTRRRSCSRGSRCSSSRTSWWA